MKRWITWILCIMMALSLVPAATAEENTEQAGAVQCADAKTILMSGQWGDEITWTLDEDYTLTFDGRGFMWDVVPDEQVPGYRDVAGSIRRIEVKGNIWNVGEGAFDGAGAVSLSLSASVQGLHEGNTDLKNLETITVDPGSRDLMTDGVALYTWAYGELVLYPSASRYTEYEIPQGVYRIHPYAAKSAHNLKTLIVPESVYNIEDGAFSAGVEDVWFRGAPPTIVGREVFGGTDGTTIHYPSGFAANWAPNGETTWHGYRIEAYDYTGRPGGKAGDNVNWTLSEDGTMTFSGTGRTWDLDWADPTYANFTQDVKRIVIESGVTYIGSMTMCDMPNLEEVWFSDTVTGFGEANVNLNNAIVHIDPDNRSLELIDGVLYGGMIAATAEIASEITIRDGTRYIPRCAFMNVGKLKKVTIPGTVLEIGDAAFKGAGLEAVYFRGLLPDEGDGGAYVFENNAENFTIYYRKELAYAWEPLVGTYLFDQIYPMLPYDSGKTYPEGARFCGDDVIWTLDANGTLKLTGSGLMWNYYWARQPEWLAEGDRIKKVVVGEGITSIGAMTFSTHDFEIRCSNLTSVSLPASLTQIGDWFSRCPALSEIRIASGNQSFTVKNNVLYTKDMKELLRVIPTKAARTLWIPNGVTTVREAAFLGADALERVMVPATVKKVQYAFMFGMLKAVYYFGEPISGAKESDYYYGNADGFTIFYPAKYASKWAPEGETTTGAYGYPMLPFESLPFTAELDGRDVQFKGTTAYTVFTGEAQKPRVILKDEDGIAIDRGYFRVTYRSNTDPGTAYADVQWKIGGQKSSLSFKIYLPATDETTVANTKDGVSISWAAVPNAKGYVIYRRAWNPQSSGWTAFERWNNTTQTTWTDTKVYAGTRYQYGVKAYFSDPMDNFNLGLVGPLKTTVRITTRTLRSLTPGTKKMTVKWDGSKQCSGYQIKYATDRSFTKNVAAFKVARPDAYQTTVKNLKSGTTYYVTVRSYQVFEGMTYFGEWSEPLSCKVR